MDFSYESTIFAHSKIKIWNTQKSIYFKSEILFVSGVTHLKVSYLKIFIQSHLD